MGLLSQNQETYYGSGNSANYGDYQFVSLDHIVSSFMVMNVGEGKIISKVKKTDVQFHAMRAIQEFSYDIFRSVKSQEIEVPNTLKMILPQDYVNYVKVTRSGSDGIERNLYPTGKTSNPFAISQVDGVYQFDGSNNLIEQDATNNNSDTWTNFKSHTSEYLDASRDDYETDDEIIHQFGRRYGLDPQHAHQNGTFYIDQRTGHVHFGSNLSGVTVILHYISDGLGTDGEMVVHKFAEEAVYKWIAYGVLSSRSNIPEYIVQRFKKERFAEARKAKIRLSSIKIEEFTQVLKGLSKPIK
tara:strand:+ start:30 stop:926 length:897 start_codon:yes stop_codon:yes gene_type:complete